jgi:hypothetical protein
MDRLNARQRIVTSRSAATLTSHREVRQVNGQAGSK